jgi:hypothetical protein
LAAFKVLCGGKVASRYRSDSWQGFIIFCSACQAVLFAFLPCFKAVKAEAKVVLQKVYLQ